ncbi:erythromycin esterase family protein [Deinococcus sp. Marseille-Q6407]|uniref:erythromycin esterase family protein n=1 Tax=Deinococcus sp. Marseille-Q6407 TaxID=2969223 RepID=UPI0021BFCC8C|nr:erythromycin esterase family protein [Deinococcus sp. Marseille-Q6407]
MPAEIQDFYRQLAEQNTSLAATRFILDHATPDHTQSTLLGQQETRKGLGAIAQDSVVSEMKSQLDILSSQPIDGGFEVKTRSAVKGILAGPGGVIAESRAPISWTNDGVDYWRQSEGQWKLQRSQPLKQTTEFQGQQVTVEAELKPAAEVLARRKAAVKEVLQPLPTLQFAGDLHDPAWLAPYGAAQLVGLGEGSHGTEEIHQLKAQLFKQLATHHGFTVLTFEADPGYVYKLNRWVLGEGDEDLRDIFALSQFNFTTQTTSELLTWMRQQNKAGHQPPFEVWGIDSRTPSFTAGELYRLLLEGDAKRNTAALIQLSPERWYKFINDIDAFPEERQALKNLAGAVAQLPASDPKLADIQYLAGALGQFDELLDAYTAARDPKNAAALNRSLSLENEFMARNAQKATAGRKGAVWAHNIHVGRSLPGSGSGIGTFLGESLGAERYQIICSTPGRGKANAFEELSGPNRRWEARELLPPVAYQIDGLAASALPPEQPAGYISLKDFQAQPALKEWLGKGMNFSQIGLLYAPGSTTYQYPMNLDSCDGYVFVRESSPSRLVKQSGS